MMGTFNLSLILYVAACFTPAMAFFRMSCPGRIVRERLDPIVSPGGVASHVHTISGGAGFSADMTYEDARAANCSSCQIKEDMSNYWTPQLYVKMKNGTFRPVPVMGDGQDTNGGMTVYYFQRGPEGEKIHAFPKDFRMLTGDTTKRNVTDDDKGIPIEFACLGAGDRPTTKEMPNISCPDGLRAQVMFPSCWNGQDLDSPDHKSHVVYPGGEFHEQACPSEFPVHLVTILFEVLYDTAQFDSEWDGDQHPFVFAQGDPTGYGLHGDFVNGWDVDVLQNAIDTCLDNTSGDTKLCGAITLFTDDECNSCKLPPVVDEQVDGTLDKLPGCNPISAGPEPATPPSDCPTTALSAPIGNFVDLTSSKQWAYTGCGPETIGGRAFTGKTTDSDDMTVETCVDFCSNAGFSYAGLEYGRECYCGNTLQDANKPEDGALGNCMMRCAGNEEEVCGAAGSLSIYHKCDSEANCENMQIGVPGGGGGNATATTETTHVDAKVWDQDTPFHLTPSPLPPSTQLGANVKAWDQDTPFHLTPSPLPPSTRLGANVKAWDQDTPFHLTPSPLPPSTQLGANANAALGFASRSASASASASPSSNIVLLNIASPASPSPSRSTLTTSLSCTHNNCLNQINKPTASSSAVQFCPQYTAALNTNPDAIPSYFNNCNKNPQAVSSACSCLMGAQAQATATPVPRVRARRHRPVRGIA